MTIDQKLFLVANGIGEKWFEVGTWLGLPYDSLMTISNNANYASQGVTMMATHMLQQWKRKATDSSCFYSKLNAALKDAGFHNLA